MIAKDLQALALVGLVLLAASAWGQPGTGPGEEGDATLMQRYEDMQQRLRTRLVNRHLFLDKLPSNHRWRQVARAAYSVLSKVSHDPEAKDALEQSAARLREIVEERALG